MNHERYTAYQQRQYEIAYRDADDEYGFPDRKIADGRQLRGQRILSIGCGVGNDVWYLASDNLVAGLDYAMAGLVVGKRHGIQGAIADLNAAPVLPYQDAAFDIVILKDILEHLIDPLAVLTEAARVVRPTGSVVINVPNHFYLPLRWRLLLGKGLIWTDIGGDHRQEYREWNYMHIRFFTYGGFQAFLNQAGLRPTKWFFDFGSLVHYANPEMWLEPQLWKRAHGYSLSHRGRIGLYVILPLWKILNLIVPNSTRVSIAARAPGLLCSSFYVRAVKVSEP